MGRKGGPNNRLIVMENCLPENGDGIVSSTSSASYGKKKQGSDVINKRVIKETATEIANINKINLNGSTHSIKETMGKLS